MARRRAKLSLQAFPLLFLSGCSSHSCIFSRFQSASHNGYKSRSREGYPLTKDSETCSRDSNHIDSGSRQPGVLKTTPLILRSGAADLDSDPDSEEEEDVSEYTGVGIMPSIEFERSFVLRPACSIANLVPYCFGTGTDIGSANEIIDEESFHRRKE